MGKAKIFYFTLQDKQTKEEKLEWFESTPFEKIPFDHITPDKKANWINLTDNDFDDLLPLIDKEVKAGRSEEAVFKLFSRGVATQRDEWVYDFSKNALTARMKYFVEVYQERLKKGTRRELDIKWDRELEKYFSRSISKKYQPSCVVKSSWRPFIRKFFYFDKHFNGMTYQMPALFPDAEVDNPSIFCTDVGTQSPFMVTSTNCVPDLHLVGTAAQCLPLYRYAENGNRIDNITDWALEQFRNHYRKELAEGTRGLSPLPTPQTETLPDVRHDITKLDIFHYTYAVLHHPAYRTKYEINLKREFPRLPFYANFHQWATWGKTLMDLHLNYETIEPYDLKRVDKSTGKTKPVQTSLLPTEDLDPQKPTRPTTPKAKLKAEKADGKIILDTETTLEGIPALAWDYKLGNRSALEWILDQYKEKTPKDPTIRELFNTYKFADYKDHVIDLLKRVCTVSLRTMEIIHQMPDTVNHQGRS